MLGFPFFHDHILMILITIFPELLLIFLIFSLFQLQIATAYLLHAFLAALDEKCINGLVAWTKGSMEDGSGRKTNRTEFRGGK
jgi:hypothetical protein